MVWQLPDELHYTAWTGERTIAAIEDAHHAGTPFFVWSSYHDPHPPYCVPEPWASMYDPADMEIGRFVDGEFDNMPEPHRLTRDANADFSCYDADGRGNHGYHPHVGMTDDQLKKAQAIYYGMISFMDYWIGQTLDTLEQLGILDDTLIVFTSDHGHFIGHHGLVAKGPFHYDDVIRVPYIAAFGDRLPRGTASESIQSLVDIAPTFLAAAGFEHAPLHMQGIDQLSADFQGRDVAIVENHHQAGKEVHLRTLVTDRYKLTVYRDRPDWGELFDLHNDPGEHRNLFHDAANAAIRADMMQRLVLADLDREPAPEPRTAGA